MSDQRLPPVPTEYSPFDTLVICSNRVNARIPLMMAESGPPLLVGRGPNPRVWMAVTSIQGDSTFFYIVQDNSPLSPQVQITSSDGTTTVTTGDTVLCKVTKVSDKEATIVQLDLRPVGLNIFGDADELSIAGTRLKNSKIGGPETNVGIMLGGEPARA